MTKNITKKKNIRLRRRMRKTMGVVCLITAILVAAIPVPEAKAAEDKKYLWDEQIGIANSVIPVVPKNCDTIYTTGDGTYQFAFVNASSTSPDKVAVILGYTAGNLSNNYLQIPDTVDAFTKYSENQGTRTGYVAVSRSQKPLYYMSSPEKWEVDVSGNDIKVSDAVYKPCYYSDYINWSTLDLTNFYYKNDAGEYLKTNDAGEQWIKNITVMYIGNQSLMANPNIGGVDGAVQEWVIAEAEGTINELPQNGVFANESNIKTLIVGDSLMGIGNYSFNGCTNLESITLGNGLTEMGKYAFANCANMHSIGLDFTSRIQYISDYTFLNCRALTSFALPSSVTTIYDHAFEGCTRLGSEGLGGVLDLSGAQAGKNVTLSRIGNSVFKGCSELQSIILPESMSSSADSVNLNNFEGCTSLNHIKVESPYTTFEGTTNYTVDSFKKDVAYNFYFEGAGTSSTHEFTKANAIAFKYSDKDCYEIIIIEEAVDGISNSELTYQVNSNNELLWFNMTKPVTEVNIPEAIGPYGISAISANSFSGNCYLNKITIPSTVTSINENAFRGCHNLKHVIFINAASITYIGPGAFATQEVDLHAANCANKDFLTKELSPTLTFTGAVGTGIVPFDYAMNASSNINAGPQTKSYITYYSGWPTNLEIKYTVNQDTGTGAATLIDYPTYTELKTGSKYTVSAYPYITTDYETAAKAAITKYEEWRLDNGVEVTDYQWQIINAALNLSVPAGVKAVETGLFSGVTGMKNSDGTYIIAPVSGQSPDENIQTITFADILEYAPYSFSGCKSLKKINITGGTALLHDYAFAYAYTVPDTESGSDSVLQTVAMSGGGSSIGDYAFCNNKDLNSVTLSSTVSSLGTRPFKDCQKLESVNFSGGPYFTTAQAIIYGLQDGSKTSVIQCLESRGKLGTPGSISATELAGVTEIKKEAFMDCSEIGSVDLSSTLISTVPESSFRNTSSLYSAILPTSCKSISKYAFWDSNIRYVDIPRSVTFIDPIAFNTEQNPNSDGLYNMIEFYCEAGSAAETYAGEYESISTTDKPVTTSFTVIFWDYDKTILDTQTVPLGADAKAPPDPVREGFDFDGWVPPFTGISKDTDVVAQYIKKDSEDKKFTVEFMDYNEALLWTQKVNPGEDAIPPQPPVREGYRFIGWLPGITNITENKKVYAQYEKVTPGSGNNGGNGGNSGNNGSGGGTTSGNGTTNNTLYTLSVQNGSGSGSYVAGANIPIVSNEPASTQKFSKWTTDNANVKFASNTMAATILVMPASNATVTATYVNKPADGNNNNSGGGGSTSGGNSGNGGNTTSGNKTGTVVIIDKNGLSNTGVVSVTVKGSSDNFIVKITENEDATAAVLRALMSEYGSLDNLKYFPMDISLYDSTGQKKITDTSGLSISITLPIPDSLITYAGNNRVAGVVNDTLDKLAPKFTTIDGVSCVTFTAEHFSPYVIYVKTDSLESTGVTDTSPKTGDIHPKWFVAIGLSCMAVILFIKRDKNGNKVMVQI